MKRRIFSIITALAMCLSLCPARALASETDPETGLTILKRHVYNGQPQNVTLNLTVGGGFQLVQGTHFDVEYDTTDFTNVGKIKATLVDLPNGPSFNGAAFLIIIDPAPLTITAKDQAITYGNDILQGTNQVTADALCGSDSLQSVTLTASSDQVAAENKTVTPSATMIRNSSGVDVTGNYDIKYETGKLTINKADITITTAPAPKPLAYTGEARQLVSAGVASAGEIVYSLSEAGPYSTAIPTGTNAGDYTVWYKVEGTSNYNGIAPVKVDVSIAKADYTGTKAASTSARFGTARTFSLLGLLPEGATAGTASTTGDIFAETPTVSGESLSYKLKEDAAANSTGTITVPVACANYKDFNLSITVTVTDKDMPTLAVKPIVARYTGRPVTIQGEAKVDGKAVGGSWSFEGQAPVNVADSGTYQVIFTPTDGEKFATASTTIKVTISKATPSGAPKYTAISTSGKTLADAGLSTGGGAFSVPGTVAWEMAGSTQVTAGASYKWVFTPTDTGNYNTLSGSVVLWSRSMGGGGSSGDDGSACAVTVAKPEHGTVAASRTSAAGGDTVTLTVTPDSGYVLDTLAVTDRRGNEAKLTAQANGKYTFTMPGRAVTVTAAFAPIPGGAEKPCGGGAGCPSRGFTDLGGVGTWYHEAVDYVLLHGLMGGYGDGLFGPDDTLSRAQLAQILYHMEGRPAVSGSAFDDVEGGAWYAAAVTWAAQNGIVGGYGDGMFGPNDPITREQLAAMLWRYAGSPAATNKELHFTDADGISGYALNALRWAVEKGILNGYGGGRLVPGGQATRAQAAQMLKSYLGGR